jgi:hypothetical protein
MKKRISISKTKPTKRITIETTGDGHEGIMAIAEYFKKCGRVGHSTTVVVDSGGDDEFKTGFDGDGADAIVTLNIEDIDGKNSDKSPTSTGKG